MGPLSEFGDMTVFQSDGAEFRQRSPPTLRAWSQGDGSALPPITRWSMKSSTVSHGAICARSGPIIRCRRRHW